MLRVTIISDIRTNFFRTVVSLVEQNKVNSLHLAIWEKKESELLYFKRNKLTC